MFNDLTGSNAVVRHICRHHSFINSNSRSCYTILSHSDIYSQAYCTIVGLNEQTQQGKKGPEIDHGNSQDIYRQCGDQYILQQGRWERRLRCSGRNGPDINVPHDLSNHVISPFYVPSIPLIPVPENLREIQ